MPRQGDVLIVHEALLRRHVPRLATPPAEDAAPAERGSRLVIARGEVTGHTHVLEAASGEAVECFSSTADHANAWLRVSAGGATLRHDEHGPHHLEPGRHRRLPFYEYWPEEVRGVAD